MITYIVGELTDIEENVIILEAYGVGYEIMVPASIVSLLPPLGTTIKIFTYQNVREDALDLYGFINREDLRIFKLLIMVNGIGPKGALNILSTISPDELRYAVLSDDVKKIQGAPGIGVKTAQKLIIELKDKLDIKDVINTDNRTTGDVVSGSVKDETVAALIALGYSGTEAVKAVNGIQIEEGMTSEVLLKKALKQLAFM